MSSSTRKTLRGLARLSSLEAPWACAAHQLKPSRGFSGSATIPPAMVAARCGSATAAHHGAPARMVVSQEEGALCGPAAVLLQNATPKTSARATARRWGPRWLQRSLTGTQPRVWRGMRVMAHVRRSWATSNKKAPAHDTNTTLLQHRKACERRTPWPPSAAVETPRCTPPQRPFLPTAPPSPSALLRHHRLRHGCRHPSRRAHGRRRGRHWPEARPRRHHCRRRVLSHGQSDYLCVSSRACRALFSC
jgi:hypothetical protein